MHGLHGATYGYFNATMEFPLTYPNQPPKLVINSEFYHPNVYPDGARKGEVCISILHQPGEDQYGYELASERWLPIHSVESILVSVISMLLRINNEAHYELGRVDPRLGHLDALRAEQRLARERGGRKDDARGP